ncbi:MAG: hypothetical protein U1A78_28835 [Polyangia bacterium]
MRRDTLRAACVGPLGALLLVGAALGSGCGREPPAPDLPATAQQPLTLSPAALGTDGRGDEPARPVPRGLRAAYLQQRQREAGPEHALSPQADARDTLIGRSPEQGMELRLDRGGVVLSAPSSSSSSSSLGATGERAAAWQVRTALTAVRCGAVTQPLVAAAPRVVEPGAGSARATEVRYERGRGLTEWYLNGPLGLEQGFTVAVPPDCGGAAPELRFDLAITTSLSVRDRGADTLELFDAGGVRRVAYGELYAADADGRELPARLTWDAAARTARLHVDARDARYPLRIDPLWSEQAKLRPFDGDSSHYFASDVAISGDTAVVGAVPALVGLVGKVYVFVRSGGVWSGQRVLTASDGTPDDNFGAGVAISGDTILVGALRASVGGRAGAGKTYVFRRSGTPPTWTQEAILTSILTATTDGFGYAVAISGETALIGVCGADVGGRDAAGQAEVFVRSGTSWARQAVLSASDPEQWGFFGCSAALHGDTALIGAYGADVPGKPNAGKAYVFARSGTAWRQQSILTASDGAANDYLGADVALFGSTAVVGAAYADAAGLKDSGKAYVFTRSGTTWSQQAALTASDPASEDYFGSSVAVADGAILVGAYRASPWGLSHAGKAYAFAPTGTPASWTQRALLTASDVESLLHFGDRVAIGGDTALIGASFLWNTSAGAYVFQLTTPQPNGSRCSDSDECTSGFCADGVCCDSACGGGVDSDCQACSAAKKQSGSDGTCGPARAAAVCRPAAGGCDVAEACDGSATACPADVRLAARTLCRAAAGDCDVAEVCDGLSALCPSDARVPAGTTCRGATGSCDAAESCDGESAVCPADAKKPAGSVCRAAAGPCDRAESCDGLSAACPTDQKAPAGQVCRPATGPCDQEETCSGRSISCPTNKLKPSGSSCRAAAGPCDEPELCSGTSAACPTDALKPNTAVCRAAAGPCDLAEFCSGAASACPADQFKPVIAVCRPTLGLCDLAEYCTGGGPACPPDDLLPAGTVCRDVTGACDQPEVCSGTRASCPADSAQPDGTACPGGQCKAGLCI